MIRIYPVKARDKRRITMAVMKYIYMRKIAGYTWKEHKTDCKGTTYNPSFGQNTGLQKKMIETYKQNTL